MHFANQLFVAVYPERSETPGSTDCIRFRRLDASIEIHTKNG